MKFKFMFVLIVRVIASSVTVVIQSMFLKYYDWPHQNNEQEKKLIELIY